MTGRLSGPEARHEGRLLKRDPMFSEVIEVCDDIYPAENARIRFIHSPRELIIGSMYAPCITL